jgi:hypothetical protein
MKTTDEQIYTLENEYMKNALKGLTGGAEIESFDLRDAFKAGFKACEAKMLAGASDPYNEHEMAGDVARFAGTNRMSYEDVAEYFFAAGAMSQAKKLSKDYELGKELSHEDLFRLLKHQQKSAEINLGLYNDQAKKDAERLYDFASLIDFIANLVEEERNFFWLGDNLHSAYGESIKIIEDAREALKQGGGK